MVTFKISYHPFLPLPPHSYDLPLYLNDADNSYGYSFQEVGGGSFKSYIDMQIWIRLFTKREKMGEEDCIRMKEIVLLRNTPYHW